MSLARVPSTILFGNAKPDLVAKAFLIELLPYVAMLYLLVGAYGVAGAALAYVARSLADLVLLGVFSRLWRATAGQLAWAVPQLVCALAIAAVLSGILMFLVALRTALYMPVGTARIISHLPYLRRIPLGVLATGYAGAGAQNEFLTRMSCKVLHIAEWCPNPWDDVEGNFVREQYELFRQVTDAWLVNVQVRADSAWMRYRRVELGADQRGYYQSRVQTLLTTLLLIFALLKEKVWRYDLLHVHIAWPLLAHAHLWQRFVRKPVLISEHYSAYHFNFGLSADSPALVRLRRPFLNRGRMPDLQGETRRPQISGPIHLPLGAGPLRSRAKARRFNRQLLLDCALRIDPRGQSRAATHDNLFR